MSLNELGYQTVRVLHTCTICSAIYEPGREMTCSDACHEELMNRLIAQFGEFKKMVRMTTGETFKVPTRDIIEKGIGLSEKGTRRLRQQILESNKAKN